MSESSRSLSIHTSRTEDGATTSTTTSAMATTQTLPILPPPFFHSGSPQSSTRFQLPPLIIQTNSRPHENRSNDDRRFPSGQQLNSGVSTLPLRPIHAPAAATLSQLLSPQPFSLFKSDTHLKLNSPLRSPAHTEAPALNYRSGSGSYEHEHQRQQTYEPRYLSSSGIGRSESILRSSASIYAPGYSDLQHQYGHANPRHPPPLPSIPAYPTHILNETGPVPLPSQNTQSMSPPQNLAHQPRYLMQGQTERADLSPTRLDNLSFELRLRQQPIAARACGFGERDRRVIDPPPIIQLTVSDSRTRQVDLDELRYSLNVVHCTLWHAYEDHEETALEQPDRRATRRLMGQLVASPSVAKNEHDQEGCFFCFPDLSCRAHGKYRLRFVLIRIDPANLYVGGTSPILTTVLSDVFTVYKAKDFPGIRPSSALTRALKLQGCNIQLKKGNEKVFARKRSFLGAGGEDEGEDRTKKLRN